MKPGPVGCRNEVRLVALHGRTPTGTSSDVLRKQVMRTRWAAARPPRAQERLVTRHGAAIAGTSKKGTYGLTDGEHYTHSP